MKHINDHSELHKLIRQAVDYDPIAQRKIYDLFALKMYNTAFRILKNKHDVEDCLQVAFSTVFQKIHQYDHQKGLFQAWLARIFINQSLAIIRKRKVHFENLKDDLTIISNVPSIIQKLETDYIYNLLDMLPDHYRVIFNLYEIEGYKHKEIAAQLGITISSSRAYLSKAKTLLKEMVLETRKSHIGK